MGVLVISGFSGLFMFGGIMIANLGLLSSIGFLSSWSFLVLSRICTLGWLKPRVPSLFLSKYFLVSALGGLLYLLGSFPFSFSQLFSCGGLLLSLGFPPFHF